MDDHQGHLLLPKNRWSTPGFTWCMHFLDVQDDSLAYRMPVEGVSCQRCLTQREAARDPGHPMYRYILLEHMARSPIILSPEVAAMYCMDMVNEAQMQLKCLALSSTMRVLHEGVVAIGDVRRLLTSPREVLRFAIQHNADSFILVQNQPSGEALIEDQERELAKRFYLAGELVQVHCYDYLVIAHNGWKSLREETFIWP